MTSTLKGSRVHPEGGVSTRVLPCVCASRVQDKWYGSQQRLHNYKLKGLSKQPGWRCTVCAREKSAGIAAEKPSEKTA